MGCILSLFGCLGVLATAILIRQWRERDGSVLIINMCLSTLILIILFFTVDYTSYKRRISDIPCIIAGASLHYALLVSFFLTVFASNCQYRRYVDVFSSPFTQYFKLKMFLCGWITPAMIVIVSLSFDANAYLPKTDINGDICYPTGLILWIGVHAPILTIIILNIIIFILIVYNLNFKTIVVNRTSIRSNVINQCRLYFYMFFLLSIMWISGFVAVYIESIICCYLFVITSTIQGFVIFLYCVFADPKTRRYWFIFFKCTKFGKPDISYLPSTVTNQ